MYAIVMIFVYPVGIPFALGWWLFRHREELQAGQPTYRVRPAADLWGPYRPARYYYEVSFSSRMSAAVEPTFA